MKKLEVFFDYYCPYCLKGHEQLLAFLKDKPELEVIWHPCEVSKLYQDTKRMKRSDIFMQGMFFAAASGADLWQYHEKVYALILNKGMLSGNTDVFSDALKGVIDGDAFRLAYESGKMQHQVEEANAYAFNQTGVHVLPTYRADDGVLQDRQEFFHMGPSDTAYNIR